MFKPDLNPANIKQKQVKVKTSSSKAPSKASRSRGPENRTPDEIKDAAEQKTAEWSDKLDLSKLTWITLRTLSGTGTCLNVGAFKDSDDKQVYLDYVLTKDKLFLIDH